MTKVIHHEGALADLRAAVGYFETEARHGTTEKFLQQVDRAVAAIKQFPESCPAFDKRHFRQRVFKFSYELIYRMEGDDIVIVAVSHSSRDPSYWRDRR